MGQGRLCKPNPPLVSSFLSSFTFHSFARSADGPQAGQAETREREEASPPPPGSCKGRPQRRIATNLGAPGQVQVDEVAEDPLTGQVTEAFIC